VKAIACSAILVDEETLSIIDATVEDIPFLKAGHRNDDRFSMQPESIFLLKMIGRNEKTALEIYEETRDPVNHL
jgi:hypothetical protein